MMITGEATVNVIPVASVRLSCTWTHDVTHTQDKSQANTCNYNNMGCIPLTMTSHHQYRDKGLCT